MLNLMLDRTIVSTTSTAPRVPVWLKLAYTAFMAVLVPVYLRNYGPTNFLYFCDVALIITLVGIWIESPFSFPCVGRHYRVTDPLGDRFPLQPDHVINQPVAGGLNLATKLSVSFCPMTIPRVST